MRDRNRARSGGACRGLGFTSPHRVAGSELRPPVALGAESHLRPWSEPKVIFNQRRSPEPPAPTASRTAGSQQNHRNHLPAAGKDEVAPARALIWVALVPGPETRMRTQSSAGAGPHAANHRLFYILLAQRHWGGTTEISRPLAPYKGTVGLGLSLFFFVKTREWFYPWLSQIGLGRHRTGSGMLRPRSIVEPGLGARGGYKC